MFVVYSISMKSCKYNFMIFARLSVVNRRSGKLESVLDVPSIILLIFSSFFLSLPLPPPLSLFLSLCLPLSTTHSYRFEILHSYYFLCVTIIELTSFRYLKRDSGMLNDRSIDNNRIQNGA